MSEMVISGLRRAVCEVRFLPMSGHGRGEAKQAEANCCELWFAFVMLWDVDLASSNGHH
jgi:hypothetical protein